MANEVLKLLDTLLQDYEDKEREFYLNSKTILEEGFYYSITHLELSDKQEKCKPLNLIKPFFVLFHTNDKVFYKAKYKKRKILTSFRGNLTSIPLCLDDELEFKIIQNNMTKFNYEGSLSGLINDFPLSLNPELPIKFYIKLLKTNDSRMYLEREMDSHAYISNILSAFTQYSQSSRFVISKSKQNQVNLWFAKYLNLKNFDIFHLSMEHLKILTKDILILEKIIASLRSGQLSLIDTKEIASYKENMDQILKQLEQQQLEFDSAKVILNYKMAES